MNDALMEIVCGTFQTCATVLEFFNTKASELNESSLSCTRLCLGVRAPCLAQVQVVGLGDILLFLWVQSSRGFTLEAKKKKSSLEMTFSTRVRLWILYCPFEEGIHDRVWTSHCTVLLPFCCSLSVSLFDVIALQFIFFQIFRIHFLSFLYLYYSSSFHLGQEKFLFLLLYINPCSC